jgi:hypothetical protein
VNNIKMDLGEVGRSVVDWIVLAQDRDWRAVTLTASQGELSSIKLISNNEETLMSDEFEVLAGKTMKCPFSGM